MGSPVAASSEGNAEQFAEPFTIAPHTRGIPGVHRNGGASMSNKPEKIFQHGALKAAIFANEHEKDGESFTVRRVSFQKLYRDKEGNLKTTSSLEVNDLPKAVVVLQKAFEYLTVRDFDEVSPIP
jgi:hypothetical protein